MSHNNRTLKRQSEILKQLKEQKKARKKKIDTHNVKIEIRYTNEKV